MADQDLYGETTALDAKLITIKKQIAAKLDVQSAFADREVQSRNLRAKFKYCGASAASFVRTRTKIKCPTVGLLATARPPPGAAQLLRGRTEGDVRALLLVRQGR
jgi:hypothetical protein